jgi:hypothetical protein
MARDALEQAVGKAHLDATFATQVLNDDPEAFQKAHLDLNSAERSELKALLLSDLDPQDVIFQRQSTQKQITAQIERTTELGQYTVRILKDTLAHATRTYKSISSMTRVLFYAGLTLFVAAAITSLVLEKQLSAFIMGGLGVTSFVSIFLIGPMEKSQAALSNLVQVEVLFMDFFEQITLWESYGL